MVLKDINSNEQLRLICREPDSLVIEIQDPFQTNDSDQRSQRKYKGFLYVLKLQDNNSDSLENIIYFVSVER